MKPATSTGTCPSCSNSDNTQSLQQQHSAPPMQETNEGTSRIQQIKAVIFDLDGTLLDTETLSDVAMYKALNVHDIEQQRLYSDPDDTIYSYSENEPIYRLPWALKRQILGLRSQDWGPIVMQYAQDVWKLSPTEHQIPTTINELIERWEYYLQQECCNVRACPGADELVQSIAAQKQQHQQQSIHIPMAIATSSIDTSVQRKRIHHEKSLFQYISKIICGNHPNVQSGKPAPDIYLEAIQQLNNDIFVAVVDNAASSCVVEHIQPHEVLVFEDAYNGVLSAKAAGCHVVAIPDQRYNQQELQAFYDIADMVIPTLWEFSGVEQFHLNIDMRQLYHQQQSI